MPSGRQSTHKRAMFKNLRTSTKLFILCGTFIVSVGVPIYGLVTEKQIAIDFARKELVGNRYLATLRAIYTAILTLEASDEQVGRPSSSADETVKALADAEAEAGGALQTAEFAQALAATLRDLWSSKAQDGKRDALVLNALSKAQTLASRIGDDSNLALDPDLDSYYLQHIVVRKLPMFLAQLSELQEFFQATVAAGSPSLVREVRLPILQGLLRSTAGEVKDNLAAAYRGNPDGSLKQAVDAEFAAMMSSMNSYLGVLNASTTGVDARDAVAFERFHGSTVQNAIKAWAAANPSSTGFCSNVSTACPEECVLALR